MEGFIQFSIVFLLPDPVKLSIIISEGAAPTPRRSLTGVLPGIASVGGLIVGVENRDANTNVKFHQKDTPERIITRIERHSKVVICNFRADCGSFSSSILGYVKDHCERFYIRANNCGSRRTEFMEHTA